MKQKTINSLYVYFFGVMFIVYGCSGNEICINLIEQSIVTVEGGDIRRFEIDVNDTIYYFHLKEDIRHQNAVDLRNVYKSNRLDEVFPSRKKAVFLLRPKTKYTFTNSTVYDASAMTIQFYTDSLGNLNCADNRRICK